MKEPSEILKYVPICERLSEKELGEIAGIGMVRSYRKDQIIFLEGEEFTGFFVVPGGSVRVFKLSANGDETVLHMLKPYRSFAETPLFTGSDE